MLARNFVDENENSTRDFGLFVDGAKTIQRTFECTVSVVHLNDALLYATNLDSLLYSVDTVPVWLPRHCLLLGRSAQ